MSTLSHAFGRLVSRRLKRLRRWFRWRRRSAHLRLGALGERLSCEALHEIGLDILCRNYRNVFGEIDLIGLEGEVLCFIEVKTRHRQELGRPGDAVDAERRRRYGRAAARYLSLLGEGIVLSYRFDVMEVVFEGRRLCEMHYIRDAFLAGPGEGAFADAGDDLL